MNATIKVYKGLGTANWDFCINVKTRGMTVMIEPKGYYYKSRKAALIAARHWCRKIEARVTDTDIEKDEKHRDILLLRS